MVNCNELRTDIKDLAHITESLRRQVGTMRESGAGLVAASERSNSAEELEDLLLQRYLDDFAEKNPEVRFQYGIGEAFHVGCRLPQTALKISDDEVLLCGDGTDVSVFDFASFRIRFVVDNPWTNTDMPAISTSVMSDGGDILLAGKHDVYELHVSATNGGMRLRKSHIFEERAGNITKIVAMPGGEILVFSEVGGGFVMKGSERVAYGKRHSCTMNGAYDAVPISEHEVLTGGLSGIQILDISTDGISFNSSDISVIDCMEKISDHEVLISGEEPGDHSVHTLGIFNSETHEVEMLEGLTDGARMSGVRSMLNLSEDLVMLGTHGGQIGFFDKKTRRVVEEVQMTDTSNNMRGIRALTRLTENTVLATAPFGESRMITLDLELTPEKLKTRLGEIAKKGGI